MDMSDGLPELTVRTAPQFLEPPSRHSHNNGDSTAPRRSSQDTVGSETLAQSPGGSDTYVASHPSIPRSPESWEKSGRNLNTEREQYNRQPLSSGGSATLGIFQGQVLGQDGGRLFEAQREWMAAAFRLHPEIRSKLRDETAIAHIDRAWSVIEEFSPYFLDFGDDRSGPGSYTQESANAATRIDLPNRTTSPSGEPSREPPQLHIVVNEPSRHGKSHAGEDYAELYYQHFSAARYRSDDLINLGPRPNDEHTIAIQAATGADTLQASSSIHTASYEYAERHLQLIDEIAFHETEAAKYKQLCVEHNIELDDDSEEDLDVDDENMYQSLLQEVKRPAPRLDSMITLQDAMLRPKSDPAIKSAGSAQDLRILEWQSEIESQPRLSEARCDPHLISSQRFSFLEPPLTQEPLSMVHEADNRVREGGHPSRQHYRSKSTPELPRSHLLSLARRQEDGLTHMVPQRFDSGYNID